ncbi:MAG: HEWD family protein [Halobacteriota archaeon]
MSVKIVPPTRRSCERCGRTDEWNEETDNWVITEENGDRLVGNIHCIHEWDINGRYNPVTGQSDDT